MLLSAMIQQHGSADTENLTLAMLPADIIRMLARINIAESVDSVRLVSPFITKYMTLVRSTNREKPKLGFISVDPSRDRKRSGVQIPLPQLSCSSWLPLMPAYPDFAWMEFGGQGFY